MQHDAINAAVLAAAKSVTSKLGGTTRQILTRRSQFDCAGISVSHGRSVFGFIQRLADDGEFMVSLPIPAINRDAS
jgi:hypothetical protein